MKGIAHFLSGVAVASFLPQAVHMSAQGSFVLLLAGLGSLMPDALDFRLARYLCTPDVEIDPHPNAPDPQAMAERLASAIERAYETGRPVYVRLHSMRLSADRWRRYGVQFSAREVQVHIGPLVTLSHVPQLAGDLGLPVGWAPIAVPARCDDGLEVQVDVFAGPALEFRRRKGVVAITFLPWHRRWSHSLTLAALLGGGIALLLGPLYGLVYALGSATHILEDQLGYMGCNLAYPFTRERLEGLRLFHSGQALPNFFAVWSSVALILFNLRRFSPAPVPNPWRFFLIGLILPWMVILALAWWKRRNGGGLSGTDIMAAEVLAEADGEHPAEELGG